MKRHLVLATAVCLFIIPLRAQNQGGSSAAAQDLPQLENYVLESPGFERPFYDLLTLTLDESGWKNLDIRWQKQEATDARHIVLRGLLAERQGEFETALAHYERARATDWGAYHHARLLAFMGQVAPAREALLALARKTSQAWIFNEAARGVGELLLLTEDAAAAERHYAALWESRPEVEMRLALMEPLITLRMELGSGREWLKKLEPPLNWEPASLSVADADQRVLWYYGSSLATAPASGRRASPPPSPSQPSRMKDIYLHMESPTSFGTRWVDELAKLPGMARWYGPLYGHFPLSSSTWPAGEIARCALDQPTLDEDVARTSLSLAAMKGSEELVRVAQILKEPLRQEPRLLAVVMSSSPRVLAEAHGELQRSVFAGSHHPLWRLWSLAVRAQLADEKPEALREEALSLWQQSGADVVFPPPWLKLRKALPRPFSPALAQKSGAEDRPGVWEPRTAMVWNVRGATFLKAMAARFHYELEKTFWNADTIRSSVLPADSTPDSVMSCIPLETGPQIRAALWMMRGKLGLDEAVLGPPATPQERASRVLVQNDAAVVRKLAQDKAGLKSLPLQLLFQIKKSLAEQQALSRGTGDLSLGQALAAVNEELLTRLPPWTLPRLLTDSPVTMDAAPSLTPEQRRELLVSHYPDAAIKKNWEHWLAAAPDSEKLNAELEAGRQSLQLAELPHALWGLQWQPSLRRRRSLLSLPPLDPDFQGAGLFLSGMLPLLAHGENEAEAAALHPTEFNLLNAASFKLINRFGFALLKPQPVRYTELRALSARHPFAEDLVRAWQAVESAAPSIQPRLRRVFLTPGQFLTVEAALARPASRDTRLMLMTLYRDFGDLTTGRPFEEECADMLLPAPQPRATATPVAGTRPASPPKKASVLQTAMTAEQTARFEKWVMEAAKSGAEDEFFGSRFTGTQSELQEVYHWLRQQDRKAPGFAARSGALAAMARRLRVSAPDRREAEELDLRLHPEDPARWLHLGVSQQQGGGPGFGGAANSFIQALKRADFSVHHDLFEKIRPARVMWAQFLTTPELRDEMAAALGTALARTPRGTARSEAARMIGRVARASDVVEKPERLEQLLNTVAEHQRHLIFAAFRHLNDAAGDMERAGKAETATRIARTLLRGVWTGAQPPADFGGPRVNDLPSDVHAAFASWSRVGDRELIDPASPMLPLFVKALRGEDAAAFADSLVKDAAIYPEDEQLVSCAAVASVMKGGAVEDALRLAASLEPQARMRVAWRICELVHPPSGDLAPLLPVLAHGLAEVFKNPGLMSDGRHLKLAERLLPWLEKVDGVELQPLLPLFAKGLAGGALDSGSRTIWLDFAQRHKAPAIIAAVARAWRRECEKMMTESRVDESWYCSTVSEFCVLASRLDGGDGHPFVLLADDVWNSFIKTWSGRADPQSGSVMQLCDQLVAYGETERLTALVSQIEMILRLGGPPDYLPLLQRAREGLDFLRTPARLATPHLWVEDVSGDETTGRVHWDLVTPMANGGFITLKRTSKTHHLKILAGGSFDGLQPVAEAPRIGPAGVVEVKKMPSAGFAQGLLCNEDASLVSFGAPAPYSLRHPLLDTADGADDSLPEWEEPQFKNCGQPITKAVPVDAGLSVVTSQIMESQAVREGAYMPLYLVALDANKKPVGAWGVADGRSARRMMPDGMRAMGLSLSSQYHMASERQVVQAPPRYIVLAAPVRQPHDPFALAEGEGNADRPGVRKLPYRAQVRAFQWREPPVSPDVPELKETPLAKVGFPIRSWQLCENHPRAVFCGDDQVVIYDTDAVPWKELLRLKDAKIAENGWVFMLSADVACFARTQAAGSAGNFVPHVWQLRCSGPGPVPASLNDCPELPLPKASLAAEMSPNEDAVLFMSMKEAHALGLVWVDSSHNARTLQIKLPEHDRDTWPFVAWWSADGKGAMIEDNGIQVPVEHTADGLRAGKTEQGPVTAATIPQGALPGGRFFKSAWVLKNGNILVRTDEKTGMPQRAYKLPGRYTGNPLWWGRRHQSVLLQTANDDLIMVQPQEAKRAR